MSEIPSRTPLSEILRSPGKIISELQDNYDDRFWWKKQYRIRFLRPMHELLYSDDGISVMEEDWDNLIVLDACRADVFEGVADLEEFSSYERKISQASNTTPWTYKNFTGREFGDTVYVTATGVVSKGAPHAFHRLVEVWRDEERSDIESVPTDDRTQQVLPEHTVNRALETHEEYPNKRLITHFIPPHSPYFTTPELLFGEYSRGISTKDEADTRPDPPRSVFEALQIGIVDREEVKTAYREHFELGLRQAHRLASELPGKTVITADHGELFGERSRSPLQLYMHPSRLRCPKLITVPWAVCEYDERKEVVDEGAHSRSGVNEEDLYEHLRDLGYHD